MSGLLDAKRSQLLIIDVQGKLLPAMENAEETEKACGILLQAASLLDIPATISEQYPEGLGPTTPSLLAHNGNAKIMEKIHFSCMKDGALNNHLSQLSHQGRDQIIVGGIESHVCVLQTVIGLSEAGFETYMVADAVSSRKVESKILAQARAQEAGAHIISVEMAVFEWLDKAGTDDFKTLSRLIK